MINGGAFPIRDDEFRQEISDAREDSGLHSVAVADIELHRYAPGSERAGGIRELTIYRRALIAFDYCFCLGGYREKLVASELSWAEQKVTTLAIRGQLGRGSFSTVKKSLDRWQEERAGGAGRPSSLPPQLESLWKEAWSAAQSEFVEARQALELHEVELQEKFESLQSRALMAEEKCREVDTRLVDLQAAFLDGQALVQDLVATRSDTSTSRGEVLTDFAALRQN